jgi:hypothetical protein
MIEQCRSNPCETRNPGLADPTRTMKAIPSRTVLTVGGAVPTTSSQTSGPARLEGIGQ